MADDSLNFTPSRPDLSWEDYFRERSHFIAASTAEEEESTATGGYTTEVTQLATRISADGLPKQPKEIVALLDGRELAIRHAVTYMKGEPYASGKKAGQPRPDKTLNHYGIATIDKQNPIVTAYWTDGAAFSYADFGYTDGSRTRVNLITELKKLIKEATS